MLIGQKVENYCDFIPMLPLSNHRQLRDDNLLSPGRWADQITNYLCRRVLLHKTARSTGK